MKPICEWYKTTKTHLYVGRRCCIDHFISCASLPACPFTENTSRRELVFIHRIIRIIGYSSNQFSKTAVRFDKILFNSINITFYLQQKSIFNVLNVGKLKEIGDVLKAADKVARVSIAYSCHSAWWRILISWLWQFIESLRDSLRDSFKNKSITPPGNTDIFRLHWSKSRWHHGTRNRLKWQRSINQCRLTSLCHLHEAPNLALQFH